MPLTFLIATVSANNGEDCLQRSVLQNPHSPVFRTLPYKVTFVIYHTLYYKADELPEATGVGHRQRVEDLSGPLRVA
jgi:anthranilate/para-aminobenzoate synthase component II